MKDVSGTNDDIIKNGDRIVGAIIDGATRDGMLAAAFRQGIDEIGAALKAFPDSIQVHESGSIWNPTQGEIAAARKEMLPSPSEIAANPTAYLPEQGKGNEQDRGQDRGMEM